MFVLVYRDNYINTSAWVLRCSFNIIGQCEKPQNVERVTLSDFHAFLYIAVNNLIKRKS